MSAANKYGSVSALEKVMMVVKLLPLPVTIIWRLLTLPFVEHNRRKGWKRTIADTAILSLVNTLNTRELQFALGDDHTTYMNWVKRSKSTAVVDEIGEGARLFWIGGRANERVILYFHGGAYLAPMLDSAPDFWLYTINELRGRGQNPSVAILEYSLVPTGKFPTQLKQAVAAVKHLLSSGIQPQNIQITGDSAGANLILQLFSHILHPVPSVPTLSLSAPLSSAYLMSPWVNLVNEAPLVENDNGQDILSSRTLVYWGRKVVAGVPEDQMSYVEPRTAPEGWYKGVDRLASKVLITAGGAECLRDDIANFAEVFRQSHKEVTFVMQPGGVHDDPFMDFAAMESRVGELTPIIVNWFFDGFQ